MEKTKGSNIEAAKENFRRANKSRLKKVKFKKTQIVFKTHSKKDK